MKITIYNLNMEKVYSICEEPVKILEVDADTMTISVEISAKVITVTENKLQIDRSIYDLSMNDYEYIKIE